MEKTGMVFKIIRSDVKSLQERIAKTQKLRGTPNVTTVHSKIDIAEESESKIPEAIHNENMQFRSLYLETMHRCNSRTTAPNLARNLKDVNFEEMIHCRKRTKKKKINERTKYSSINDENIHAYIKL